MTSHVDTTSRESAPSDLVGAADSAKAAPAAPEGSLVARCDACSRPHFELRVVDDQTLCEGCAETTARVNRALKTTRSEDPVFCDACAAQVGFDARLAVVVRTTGGGVLCPGCKALEIEGALA